MKEKKKVLFVATVVKMHINVFHLPYLKLFQDQGWETWVAAKNDYGNPAECIIPHCDHYLDVPFERNPLKLGNIKAYKQLKTLIEKENFDIVYCHTPVGAMLGRLAARRERENGTKVIYMAHGFHFYKGAPLKNWLIYYPVEKILSRFTDVLITINKEDYKRAQGFYVKKVEYVPGVGIDLNKFQPDKDRKSMLRRKLEIPEHAKVLMSVGELSVRKNQMVIVEALAKLNQSDVYYYIVCGCGIMETELKKKAHELGIEKKLLLLGFRNDVADLYNIADVFVFPSLQEGLPVAVMEAMAMGLPIVASRIRGSEDLVVSGKGGYLVDSKTVEEYVEAIKKIWDSPIGRMGDFNREKIRNYRIQDILIQVQKIFENTVEV